MKVTMNDGSVNEASEQVILTPPTDTTANYANEDSTIKHLTKENFDRAEFTNDDRTHIRVWYHNPDRTDLTNGELDHFIANMEDTTSDGGEHPYLKRIFEITTLDDIHETTYKKVKNHEKIFKEFAIRTAKEQGLVIDPIAYYDNDSGSSKIDTKFFGQTLALLFNEFDSEKSKEDLFIIKLAAFELDLIKNSNDREQKARLRKAKSPIEVLEVLMEMKSLTEIPV